MSTKGRNSEEMIQKYNYEDIKWQYLKRRQLGAFSFFLVLTCVKVLSFDSVKHKRVSMSYLPSKGQI